MFQLVEMTLSETIGRHLRTNIVGYVALFVALSGTAIALPGKGGVKSDDLARNAVKAKAIQAAAITNAKLRDGAVTSSKVSDGAIVSGDLANSAVTEPNLADDAVSRRTIVAGTINGGKLANGSVDSQKVNNGSLLAEDFAAGQLSDGFVQDNGNASATFNFPRGGEVFVNATFTTTCTATPPCEWQVTVDGDTVGGTAASGDFDQQMTLTGITATLAAGNHTFVIDPSDDATVGDPAIVAVQLQ